MHFKMAYIVVASFVLSTQNNESLPDIEDESESDDSNFEIVEQILQQRTPRLSVNNVKICIVKNFRTLNTHEKCIQ